MAENAGEDCMPVLPRKRRLVRKIIGICCAGLALSPLSKNDAWSPAVEKKPGAFWQEKEVDKWSPREILFFLQDSPWAKTVRIDVSIKTPSDAAASPSAPVVGAIQMRKIESCCRTFEVPVGGSSADAMGGVQPGLSNEPGRVWSFSATVTWMSSVIVRRAVIRQRQLRGLPMEQAEAALGPSSDFVLALSGSFLKLLEGVPADEVKSRSLMRAIRGTNRRIAAGEYIPAQLNADSMAFLIFPKTLDGKPAFSREDEALTFSMGGVDFRLECRFPLEPMLVDGKLDW
jgi:hypothetical protein